MHLIALLVYVDDIIVGSNSMAVVDDVKNYLSSRFKIRVLGKVKYFLGLEIARNQEGIAVSQRKYALDLLEDARL